MKKRIALFFGMLVLCLTASLAFTPANEVCAQGASCQAQCKVSYSACVKNATNPGGLNQCKKALQACTGNCR